MADRGSIQITVIGTTDVGQVREHNEDNLLVSDLTAGEVTESGQSVSRELGEKGFLVAVADGMGGAASGELASEMAIDLVGKAVTERGLVEGDADPAIMGKALSEALTAANGEIYRKSQAETEHRGMGTTMTAALLVGSDLSIGQVGDSRAYLMRKGKLVQVTKDQSLISQLIDDGTLTEEEAEKLGGRNIILQALGVEATVTVDVKAMEVLAGDILLLCSDGLTGMVKDAEIEKTIAEADDLRVACARLVTMANDAGGRDNITVILARVEGDGLREPMKPLEQEEGQEREEGRAASFAPPPPPEETKEGPPRIALYGGAAALVAIVLFLLLSGGSADVTFVFPASGASATLTSEEGERIEVRTPPGSNKVVVEDFEPGNYELAATLPRYKSRTLTLEVKRGELRYEIGLAPLPGDLTLLKATDRVTVRVRELSPPEGEEPLDVELELGTMPSVTLPDVPAGRLEVIQSRPGFSTKTTPVEMPPAGGDTGEVRVPLEELDPVRADVVLRFDPDLAGAKLVANDEFGEEVFRETVPEGGDVSARIRVGTHDLRVSHDSYEDETFELTIEEGESLPLGGERLSLTPLRGSVSLSGPAGAVVFVNGGEAATDQVGDDGTLTIPRLPPGTYEIEMRLEDGSTRRGVAVVRAAEVAEVEWEE